MTGRCFLGCAHCARSAAGPASSGLRAPRFRPRAVEWRSAVPPLLASPSVCGPVSGLRALRSCLRGGRGSCRRFLDCAACGAGRGVGLRPVGVSRVPRVHRRPAARVSWTATWRFATRRPSWLRLSRAALRFDAFRARSRRRPRCGFATGSRLRSSAPPPSACGPASPGPRASQGRPPGGPAPGRRPRTPPPWSACAVGLWTGLAQAPRLQSRRRDRTPSRGVSQALTPPGRTSPGVRVITPSGRRRPSAGASSVADMQKQRGPGTGLPQRWRPGGRRPGGGGTDRPGGAAAPPSGTRTWSRPAAPGGRGPPPCCSPPSS